MSRDNSNDSGDTSALPKIPLLRNPNAAADQIDAILYFLHKRYAGHAVSPDVPSLYSFLINRADVVFTQNVDHVILEKKPERNTLNILTPLVDQGKEEARRIYLLNQFGDVVVKCQKQAYEQIREMLLNVLDAEGEDVLIAEYLAFKKRQGVKV